MNPSPDRSDPLLKSLAEEAADLPELAAREARRSRAAHTQLRRRLSSALTIVVLGICASQSWRFLHPAHLGFSTVGFVQQAPVSNVSEPAEYIKVQTMQEAITEPLPIPAGLSREQGELLEAARGLPLLLVKDDAGKVVSIQVIER